MHVRVLMFSDVSQCSLSSCSLSVVFSGTQMYRIGTGAQIRDTWGYLWGYSGWGYLKQPLLETDFPDGITRIRLLKLRFGRNNKCMSDRLIMSDRKNPTTKYEYCRGKTDVSLSVNNLHISITTDILKNFVSFLLRFEGVLRITWSSYLDS